MTIEQFAAEVRAIALGQGAVAHDDYWRPSVWLAMFENGLTPQDAWAEQQHDALRAL